MDGLERRLKDAGFAFAFKTIRVKFKPTAKDLQTCEESGRELTLAVKKKAKVNSKPGLTFVPVGQRMDVVPLPMTTP